MLPNTAGLQVIIVAIMSLNPSQKQFQVFDKSLCTDMYFSNFLFGNKKVAKTQQALQAGTETQ